MKLILIIVNEEYIDEIMSKLVQNGYFATEVANTGEFIKYGDAVLLLGLPDGQEDSLIDILSGTKRHVKDTTLPYYGNVLLHVINLADFKKIAGKD